MLTEGKPYMDNAFSKLYEDLYALMEKTTPMLFDCGLLCSSACCSGSRGMLLFPGEDEYLEHISHDFSIIDTNISYGSEKVRLLNCTGTCNREKRPLACRIFPLFPFYRGDRISVEFDPRAVGTCPLLYEDIEGIYTSGLFRLKVLEAGYMLSLHDKTAGFLRMMTEELDEIARFRK